MQSSMRTEDHLRQRGAQTPSLYQPAPAQPQRQSLLTGYSSELAFSTAGSGLHGNQFPASATYSQGGSMAKQEHLQGTTEQEVSPSRLCVSRNQGTQQTRQLEAMPTKMQNQGMPHVHRIN